MGNATTNLSSLYCCSAQIAFTIHTHLCRYDLQSFCTGGILNGCLKYTIVMFWQSNSWEQITQYTLYIVINKPLMKSRIKHMCASLALALRGARKSRGWIGRDMFVKRGELKSLKNWWHPPAVPEQTKPDPALYHRRSLFLWAPRLMWKVNFSCPQCDQKYVW